MFVVDDIGLKMERAASQCLFDEVRKRRSELLAQGWEATHLYLGSRQMRAFVTRAEAIALTVAACEEARLYGLLVVEVNRENWLDVV